MAEFKFEVGGKFSTPGDDAKVRVVVDRANPIPLGEHRFVLVAVDDAGNESLPSEVVVTVFDDKQPVAKLSVVPSDSVSIRRLVCLSAEGSFDVGGTMKRTPRYVHR